MKINDPSYNATGARYGYNSQEQSTELNLEGNHTTAEFWEYDTRSARRWNLDPRPVASMSSYSTFQGNPIMFSDMRGDSIFFNAKSDFDRVKTGFDATFNETEPFIYNKTNKSLEMNPNFDLKSANLNETQIDAYNKMTALINTKDRILAKSVSFTEKVTLGKGSSLVNMSLKEKGAAGHCVNFNKITGYASPDGYDFYLYVANDLSPTDYPHKIEGLTWMHEFGHPYFRIFEPKVVGDFHSIKVEEYENNLRKYAYMRNATGWDNLKNFIMNPFKSVPSKVPVGGSATEHKREENK